METAEGCEGTSRCRQAAGFEQVLPVSVGDLLGDGFEEELIACYEPRGQEPCPPGLLAMALLLQAYDGLSDARSVDAAENDRRWQLVLGTLGEEQAPFGQGTLVRFRTRVIAHDLKRRRVTCPAGKTASIPRSRGVTFSRNDCATCQLKGRCTTGRTRTLKLHHQEDLLIKLRRDLATKPGREQRRARVNMEHSLARVAAIQGARARYKGARKNELDLNRTAAVANLQQVARMRSAA